MTTGHKESFEDALDSIADLLSIPDNTQESLETMRRGIIQVMRQLGYAFEEDE